MDEQLAEIHKRVEDLIDLWHTSDTENSLIEFLGWTREEYAAYLERHELPERELNKVK